MIDRNAFKKRLLRTLGSIWPEGTGQNGSLGTTNVLVVTVVDLLRGLLAELRSPIRVDLETNGKFAANNIRGLVIFNSATQRPTIVPLTISPGIVRLNKRVLYLGHPYGAENLMDALIAEVELVVRREAESSRKQA